MFSSSENVIIILMAKTVIYRNIMTGKISHLKEVKYQILLHMRLEECYVKVEENVIIFVENGSIRRKGSTELSPSVQNRLCI